MFNRNKIFRGSGLPGWHRKGPTKRLVHKSFRGAITRSTRQSRTTHQRLNKYETNSSKYAPSWRASLRERARRPHTRQRRPKDIGYRSQLDNIHKVQTSTSYRVQCILQDSVAAPPHNSRTKENRHLDPPRKTPSTLMRRQRAKQRGPVHFISAHP